MRTLEADGYQVHTPRSERTAGFDDPDHLEHAAFRGYALITKNPRDFRALHEEWQRAGRMHAGILLVYEDNIKGKDMEPPDVVRAIGNLLASGLPVENELHTLEPLALRTYHEGIIWHTNASAALLEHLRTCCG